MFVPLAVIAGTGGLIGRPVPRLIAVQLSPRLAERKMPSSSVPAKRVVPLTASERTCVPDGSPVLTAAQLSPRFVVRKTPPSVPAKRFVPIAASARTVLLAKPELTGAQLFP